MKKMYAVIMWVEELMNCTVAGLYEKKSDAIKYAKECNNDIRKNPEQYESHMGPFWYRVQEIELGAIEWDYDEAMVIAPEDKEDEYMDWF